MATTQAIELEIKQQELVPDEVDLETQTATQMESNLETSFQLKHSRILILLYIAFIALNITALILQFSNVINFNLIVIVNITGGILLIIWIIYQFRDIHSSIGTYFQRRELYMPLIFHLMDTSTDLAAIYIYYEAYEEHKHIISNWDEYWDGDDGDESGEYKDIENDMETNFQLFIVSILIICSYRLISSILIYLFTFNMKNALFQCCDIYIYEILIKSWQYQKMQPTLIQTYIVGLEAYFESFPQLLMGLLFILEVITEPVVLKTEYDESNATLSAIFIGFSGLLSLMSVAHKARKDDERYFKSNGNIRDIGIRCKNGAGSCNWKWFAHVVFRYLDVWVRCYCLMIIWYNTQEEAFIFEGFNGGKMVIAIILFDFVGSILIASLMNKSLNFDYISCIAITPIVSGNNIIIFCWRMVENLLLFLWMYQLSDDDILIFLILSVIGYVYVTIVSIIYAFELFLDWRCCCGVIKTFGRNTRTFQGIENTMELADIIRFGYQLKSNDIKNGDFTEMKNIKSVYGFVVNGIAGNEAQKDEFIEAWKNINHHNRGTLLHQFCRNIQYENNEKLNEMLNFIINELGYDVNEKFQLLTPLIIASRYQDNVTFIQLLLDQYDANVNLFVDNRSALYYAQKYNKCTAKKEIVSVLRDAMNSNKTEIDA